MHKILGRLVILLLAVAAPAQAEWREARTDHFILTIDDTEEGARSFATRLERFDAALRRLYGVADSADRRARPISIYALREDTFNAACRCPSALGFYRQRAEGSFIFTLHAPDLDRKSKVGSWSSQALLLHEYSHHFTFSSFPIAYPYWFVEGFAEFNANTSFEDDGSLIIGYPANYRGEAVFNGNLSSKELFDPEHYGFGDNGLDRIYGRGWLLTHYLMLNRQREGQLATYLSEMNRGMSSLDAAQKAFGDLKLLNKQLDTYRHAKLAAPLRIPPPDKAPVVTITSLSPGQAEMLPIYATALVGMAKGYWLRVTGPAERIGTKYPEDAMVQAHLAEIEFKADRIDRADKAADAALRLKPELIDALILKGEIALHRAAETKATDAASWTAARAWLLKANCIDPNAAMPLYLYYMSFQQAKATPSAGAVKALMRAQVLAPESVLIRLALARHMLNDGDGPSARALLQPLAFRPHRRTVENIPRKVVDLIDTGKVDEAKKLMASDTDEDEDD